LERTREEFTALRERYKLTVAHVIAFFPEEEGMAYLQTLIAEQEGKPRRRGRGEGGGGMKVGGLLSGWVRQLSARSGQSPFFVGKRSSVVGGFGSHPYSLLRTEPVSCSCFFLQDIRAALMMLRSGILTLGASAYIDLSATAACCGTTILLNQLHFPSGDRFVSFLLEADRPSRDVTDAQHRMLETILGSKLIKKLVAR
jgi:hypothetical protein